jgi:hypothetical protein
MATMGDRLGPKPWPWRGPGSHPPLYYGLRKISAGLAKRHRDKQRQVKQSLSMPHQSICLHEWTVHLVPRLSPRTSSFTRRPGSADQSPIGSLHAWLLLSSKRVRTSRPHRHALVRPWVNPPSNSSSNIWFNPSIRVLISPKFLHHYGIAMPK